MPFISSTTGSFYAGRRSVAGLWNPETDITALGWIDASDRVCEEYDEFRHEKYGQGIAVPDPSLGTPRSLCESR